MLAARRQISMLAFMTPAYVALGSNLGNRRALLDAAIFMLDAIPQTWHVTTATYRETAPVDAPSGSPPFLNSVVLLNTKLEPEDLMRNLFTIEADLGRRRDGTRNGPRIIDLDLILFGDQQLSTPLLTVPHPRMAQRKFVLEPLAEIAPDLVHPQTGKTIRVMLAELISAGAS